MGANTFVVTGTGRTAREAFDALTSAARYENGHGGYTGTIAEKRDFVVFEVPPRTDAAKLVDLWHHYEEVYEAKAGAPDGVALRAHWPKGATPRLRPLIKRMYDATEDKWGAAGCVELKRRKGDPRGVRRYIFFGWASS